MQVVWLLREARINLNSQHAVADKRLAQEVHLARRKYPNHSVHYLARTIGTYSTKVQKLLSQGMPANSDATVSEIVRRLRNDNPKWSTARIACLANTHSEKVLDILREQQTETGCMLQASAVKAKN